MAYYVPVMLNCEGRNCLIIGGGQVAERKVESLLAAGASLHIISPILTERLLQLAESERIRWTRREYADGDLKDAFLVHAATNDVQVNEAIALEADRLGVMVNVASRGESGSFINPAVIRRGRLTLAVSTSGAGPLAAKEICGRLEEQLGEEVETYLEFLYRMRSAVKEQIESPSMRRKILRKIHEIDILQDIQRGSYIPWSPEQIEHWIIHNQEE
ncbi:bifunctional precorrin-2 dehydrogenase/sirohydrochlorin ferrochelatase [Paenibacillus sp. GCM10028914]|uniref:precorrin-2 dehydrogenase/sirohydrochlorin ferrochelatase family protein n=1 Tax=Paenibacillus sp. GCM10028914 TaxID=3273416 RepID=UPI0036076ED6